MFLLKLEYLYSIKIRIFMFLLKLEYLYSIKLEFQYAQFIY